jgi:hypothetical protein
MLLQVDVSAMVPTVVLGLLQHVAAHKMTHLHNLKRLVIGGAAPPRSMIKAMEKWVPILFAL